VEPVSKSKFKPRALEYFRAVQETGLPLTITEHGRPVLRIVPYKSDPHGELASLRGSVLRFDDPTEPVAVGDWEAATQGPHSPGQA
jgi:prevent-host-death family protein